MTFRFRTLGGVSLEGPGGPVTGRATQTRRLAVLSLLAVAPSGTSSRDRIVGRIWPDTGQKKARHLLSDALYVLRKALGEEAIVSCGDEDLRLDEAIVWADVRDFETALEAGHLEQAVELYRGAFLDGFHVRGTAVFERWQEQQARRLASLYGEALEQLARRAEGGSDRQAAVRWWKRRAAHDPYDSRIAHALMRAFAAAGNPAAAVRHARVHEVMLDDELGLEPSPEIGKLAQRLRDGSAKELSASLSAMGDEPGGPAPVSTVGSAGPSPAVEETVVQRSWPARRRWSSRFVVPRAAWRVGIALPFLIGGFFAFRGGGSPETGDAPARLVLADFEDHTEDSLLGSAVTEAIRIDLAQSRAVALAPPAFVRSALERMRRDPDEPVTAATAREVAVREGLQGAISGSVRPVGSRYLLTAEVLDPRSGETLEGVRHTAAGSADLIAAMDSLAKGLRQRLGESTGTLGDAVPLERVTTASLQALDRYTLATRLMARGGRYETIEELLEEAIDLDSTFALAYRKLSAHLGNGGRGDPRRLEMARRAYEHREGLPDRERLLIEADYHRHVRGDDERAIAVLERLVSTYPDAQDPGLLNSLGNLRRARGDLEAAVGYYRRSLRADSLSSFFPYWNLSLAQLGLGHFEAVEVTMDTYERLIVSNPGFAGPLPSSRRMDVAAGRRDYDVAMGMARQNIERAEGVFRKYYQARMLTYYAAAAGRIIEARAATQEAVSYADREDLALTAQMALAQFELSALGDTVAALRRLREALGERPLSSLDPSVAPYTWTANILASAGHPDEARRLLGEEKDALDPEIRPEQRARARSIARAWIALAEGRPGGALDELRPLVRQMRPGTGCWNPTDVCPLYLGARAYEMEGQADSAMAVYERFLHAPFTLTWMDAWFRADALERLASLYEEGDRPDAAAETYRLLVDFWNEADPELRPRVERAERRAGALSRGG